MFLIEETESGHFSLQDSLTIGPFTIAGNISHTQVGPLLKLTHKVENGSTRSIVMPIVDVKSLSRFLKYGSPPVTFINTLLTYKVRWFGDVVGIHQQSPDHHLGTLVVHSSLTHKLMTMIDEAVGLMDKMQQKMT